MTRFRFGIRKAVAIFMMVIAGIFIFGAIVMWLWNTLMPVLFHLPVISFWQALGLLILSKILFSGFRGRGGPGGPWKGQMKRRWMNMTPEEREKFKEEWSRRCGGRSFSRWEAPHAEGRSFRETPGAGEKSPTEKPA